jgi:hypothetical protein
MLCIIPCACSRVTAKEQGTYAAMHRYYHNYFSANKQNRDKQIRERGVFAVLAYFRSSSSILGLEAGFFLVFLSPPEDCWHTTL